MAALNPDRCLKSSFYSEQFEPMTQEYIPETDVLLRIKYCGNSELLRFCFVILLIWSPPTRESCNELLYGTHYALNKSRLD